jgi:ABC-type phosphate transport system permease subunit
MTHGLLASLVALALAGGAVTEALGLHALFGAFFVGLLLFGMTLILNLVSESYVRRTRRKGAI